MAKIIQPGVFIRTPDRVDPVTGTFYSRKSRVPGPGPEPGGDLVHGEPFIITGSGFGFKSPAAPLIWDDCSHGEPLSNRWAWGSPSGGAEQRRMNYRVPGQGGVPYVDMPHDNISRVLAGGHYDGGPDGGWNVGLSIQVAYTQGLPLYIRYLLRNSPDFLYSHPDGYNYKIFHFDDAPQAYGTSTSDYVELRGLTTSNSNPYHGYNSGEIYESPDALGGRINNWFPRAASGGGVLGSKWIEHRWYWVLDKRLNANGGGGCGYLVVNNDLQEFNSSLSLPTEGNLRVQGLNPSRMHWFYHGRTILSNAGNTKYAQIGGFARYGTDGVSYRYFADLYVDTTWARVELTDNANYDAATIIEPQPPTAWSDTTISCTCNKGRLSSGEVHVFVFDASNSRQYLGVRALA